MATDSSGKLIPDNTLAAQLAATAVPPVKKPFGPPTGAAAIALAPKPSAPAAAAAADTTTPAATPAAAPAAAAPAPAPAAMTAPASAAQTQSPTGVLSGLTPAQQAGLGPAGPPINELLANYAVAQAAKSPQQLVIDKQNAAIRQAAMQAPSNPGGFGAGNNVTRPVGSIPLYG
jgi:hypothetical protein